MTLKNFASKYGYEYYVVHNAMREFGEIIHHEQNVEYDEIEIRNSMHKFLSKKRKHFVSKVKHYDEMLKKLDIGSGK